CTRRRGVRTVPCRWKEIDHLPPSAGADVFDGQVFSSARLGVRQRGGARDEFLRYAYCVRSRDWNAKVSRKTERQTLSCQQPLASGATGELHNVHFAIAGTHEVQVATRLQGSDVMICAQHSGARLYRSKLSCCAKNEKAFRIRNALRKLACEGVVWSYAT